MRHTSRHVISQLPKVQVTRNPGSLEGNGHAQEIIRRHRQPCRQKLQKQKAGTTDAESEIQQNRPSKRDG